VAVGHRRQATRIALDGFRSTPDGWSPEHVNITTTLDRYGHLYPGGIKRYFDHPDIAADQVTAARIRPTAN
jgi:hypothetical protein